MLENKRVQKPREFWISIAYFRASTVFHKGHKNAQMKVFDVCPGEKMPFFYF